MLGMLSVLYVQAVRGKCAAPTWFTRTVTTSETRGRSGVSNAADGCHNVFIDAGSNIGVHFEPEKYPEMKRGVRAVFNKLGKPEQRRQNTCVFAFEPNPAHAEHQLKTQRIYSGLGWRYHYMPVGVGTEDRVQAFYSNDKRSKGKTHEHWGFSHANYDGEVGEEKEKFELQSVDFTKWLQQVVMQRELPQDSVSAWGKPKVVVKMDIEGAEMTLLPKMLTAGVLCELDVLFGEWHARHPEAEVQLIFPDNRTIQSTIAFSRDLLQRINWLAKRTACTTFLELDDEGYLHDEVPYPTLPPT